MEEKKNFKGLNFSAHVIEHTHQNWGLIIIQIIDKLRHCG